MSPHNAALRNGRWSEAGRAYLVTTVTHERQPLLSTLPAGRCIVKALMQAQAMSLAQTLAYVVMPDHLHWLCVIGPDARLSDTVGWVKGSASRALSGRWHRGKLWQAGFHDHAIRRDEDIHRVARYIVGNPLRAGLTDSLENYPLWDAVWLEG